MSALRMLAVLLVLASASPAFAAKKPLGSGERIDVGRATVAELMRLPNVGRKKAEAIVAHRNRSPFHRIEDLLAVKGVSPGWLEKHRAHLTVGGSGTSKAVAVAKPAAAHKSK